MNVCCELVLQIIGDQPSHDVGRRAGRERHDDFHGLRRPILRVRRRAYQKDRECRHVAVIRFIARVPSHFPPSRRKTYHARQARRSGDATVRATTKLRALLTSGRIAVAPGAYRRAVGAAGRAGGISGGLCERRRDRALDRRAGPRPDLHERDRRPAGVDGRRGRRADHCRCRYRIRQRAQRAGRPRAPSSAPASRRFHLEDQTFPKKCGHYDDKSIVPDGRDGAEAQSRARCLARSRLHRDRAHRRDCGRRLCRRDRSRVRLSRGRRRHDLRRGADVGS